MYRSAVQKIMMDEKKQLLSEKRIKAIEAQDARLRLKLLVKLNLWWSLPKGSSRLPFSAISLKSALASGQFSRLLAQSR